MKNTKKTSTVYPTDMEHKNGASRAKGEQSVAKKRKLNYRIIDPNNPGVMERAVLKVLIEANAPKVDAAIHAAAETEQASA